MVSLHRVQSASSASPVMHLKAVLVVIICNASGDAVGARSIRSRVSFWLLVGLLSLILNAGAGTYCIQDTRQTFIGRANLPVLTQVPIAALMRYVILALTIKIKLENKNNNNHHLHLLADGNQSPI